MAAEMFRIGERVDVGDLEDAFEIIQTILEGDEEREEVIAYACTEGLAEKIVWMLDQGLRPPAEPPPRTTVAGSAAIQIHRPLEFSVRYSCSCGERWEAAVSEPVSAVCQRCKSLGQPVMSKFFHEAWTVEQNQTWQAICEETGNA